MSISTWTNITTGMITAIYDSYQHKNATRKKKKEVAKVWNNKESFAADVEKELAHEDYTVGAYKHFDLHDRKKVRHISTLSFKDICVQNSIKNAIESILLHRMTDDMMGGLPERGVIAIRNVTIVHDWSGYYYDGTVYTDKEEEEMIKKQYNID